MFVDVSGPVPGKVVDETADQVVGTSTDEDTTMENGGDVLLIQAEQQESSTSWKNPYEADMIARFVEKACKEPAEDRARIQPEDFLIISHYGDQCAEIQRALAKLGLLADPINRPRVINVRGVQGDEGLFVVYSLVRTHPEKPQKMGFTVQGAGLNVLLSRAQQGFFAFGNWAQLLKHKACGASWLNHNNRTASAHYWGKILEAMRAKRALVTGAQFEHFLSGEDMLEFEDLPEFETLCEKDDATLALYHSEKAGEKRKSRREHREYDPFTALEKDASKARDKEDKAPMAQFGSKATSLGDLVAGGEEDGSGSNKRQKRKKKGKKSQQQGEDAGAPA